MAPLPDDTPAVQSQWMLDIVLQLRLAAPASAITGTAIILGGEARGPLMNGTVLPGTLQWSLESARGVLSLSARYDLQADNGLRIHVADRATMPVTAASGHWDTPFSTAPDLQQISGPATAFPEALYLGRMDASQLDAGKLSLNVHRVL